MKIPILIALITLTGCFGSDIDGVAQSAHKLGCVEDVAERNSLHEFKSLEELNATFERCRQRSLKIGYNK